MDTTTTADVEHVIELMAGAVVAFALFSVAEVGIADHLADGPRSTDELARATGTDPEAVRMFLRTLARKGLFRETAPGVYALTDAGALLRSDHPRTQRPMMRLCNTSLRCTPAALHSLRTGRPAFEEVFGRPFFAEMQHDREHGARFDAAMAANTDGEAPAIVAAYDFGAARRVVDVGGGDGSFLAAVLESAPRTTGAVLEQAHVVDAARGTLARFGDRAEVVAGDFRGGIPAGADLYVLKWILHDWPDAEAVAILRAVRDALPPAGRLLVIERVLPDAGGPAAPGAESYDLMMFLLLGSRERTRAEYAALLDAAGLRLARALPTASTMTLLEAVPAGTP